MSTAGLNSLIMVSWNTRRKSVRQSSKIVDTLRWQLTGSVMAFQGVPEWTSADRTLIAGESYEIFKPDGSDCGFAMLVILAADVAFVDSGRDWAIVLAGPLLFCNLHYIRWDVERAANSLAGLCKSVRHVRDTCIRDIILVF